MRLSMHSAKVRPFCLGPNVYKTLNTWMLLRGLTLYNNPRLFISWCLTLQVLWLLMAWHIFISDHLLAQLWPFTGPVCMPQDRSVKNMAISISRGFGILGRVRAFLYGVKHSCSLPITPSLIHPLTSLSYIGRFRQCFTEWKRSCISVSSDCANHA